MCLSHWSPEQWELQRVLWLGSISWVKRRPEVRPGLQEVPPSLKYLPILGETLCLSVWSYPHILFFFIFIFSVCLFLFLLEGLVGEVTPWGGEAGREGEEGSIFCLCNVQGGWGQAEHLALLQKNPAKMEPTDLQWWHWGGSGGAFLGIFRSC